MKNALIIIEGPNGLGKTTLCLQLFTNISRFYPNYNIVYRHFTGPSPSLLTTEQQMNYQFNQIYEACNSLILKNSIFIWDRSPFGELVYGKHIRKYSSDLNYFYKALKNVDYIVCLLTKSLNITSYGNNDESVVKWSSLFVKELYNSSISFNNFDLINYNSFDNRKNQIFKVINDNLKLYK